MAVIPTGPIGVTVLGATGSIGVSTLDVIARHPERYRVVALTANTQVDRLFEQCRAFAPEYAVLADATAAEQLQQRLRAAGLETTVLSGVDSLEMVAALEQTRQVMAAIVGAAGLRPTLAAAYAGKRILLANKEALVMSGKILMDAVRENDAELLPIDSEHNAIFQSLPGGYSCAQVPRELQTLGVQKILLTASGGPFRTMDKTQLESVTPEQACAHPNWSMGQKISVDSATMMNKGLEVIEACWLFNTKPEQIQVVIHPQSIVHSMVSYNDGSVLAQMGNPDMRTPIAHAMAWPERMVSGVAALDLFEVAQLDFERPDMTRFPCLQLAYTAGEAGGTGPAILNAANEIAVQSFLDKKIRFTDIPNIISRTMEQSTIENGETLGAVLAADATAREMATAWVLSTAASGDLK
ncbi:MAG: 1-deoxy-D-xylulose-5-phosphate reductoisomerase [Gammaproteobacteria bacterium]|nr:1-deoxy-D-xylulose-5-phosphate reductoisomerase [Gammaproteobacteria bacterium]MCF6260027.1 1-deoxy-D-xylulose-5-phosphate reductoisomerase [Gammaproteobacteria bacterium]